MSDDNVRRLFPQLLSNGYVPLPNKDKECRLLKWSSIYVDERQARLWTRQTRWHAIGLRIEPPLLVIDHDLPDLEIAAAVRAITPPAILAGLERVGKPPKTAFFLRLRDDDEPFYKLYTRRYLRGKTAFQVEAFAGGRGGKQFGGFGPHSHDDAGNVLHTYAWVGGRSPANVPIRDLPEISRREVATHLDRVEAEILIKWPGLEADPAACLDAEAPHLELYDLNSDNIYVDADGIEYTHEELRQAAQAHAKMKEDFRITGSFTKDQHSSGSARCKVYWSKAQGLVIVDFKTHITHRELRGDITDRDLNALALELFGGKY